VTYCGAVSGCYRIVSFRIIFLTMEGINRIVLEELRHEIKGKVEDGDFSSGKNLR